ncbi:pyridoxal phosphate-dependent aminotransferase [Clostridium sp. D2Q-14]|uniref:pyridoxal phosphate-dependent aminotransferase n=1 Tax=Anaeromonas gelatinilytica TaxID=2683194 RepID=UPI00193C4863|nr:pyridoxal phosphate-dependent aminotransferase [Anaeromonas gelatinilytica]MBS4535980.1 pyridoxal phosphate-dependent aminotransferase [Anaeromonas gelatinilytica]
MKLKLSNKISNISPSVTLEITAKAKQMKANGIDVIGFGAGEPDFKTPENIRRAGVQAIEEGKTGYTSASGINELKQAVCDKFKRDNDLNYNLENIIISSGAKHSLFNALSAILNPGDEVIIPVPYWVSYPELVKLADGIPIEVKTLEKNDFKYSIDDLNNALTNSTKAIILNSPSNPTGTAYTKKELENIAKWAVDNKIFVISDEIYEKLIYDDNEHVSIASLNDKIKEQTIIINGMSKAYAMTGWRIGYTAAHKDIIKLMSNLQSHSTSNPTSISQYASLEGLNGNETAINEMIKHFIERRNYMVDKINSIDDLSCKKSKGAFYVMANISKLKGRVIHGKKIESSVDLANKLLDEAHVAVVPGIAFGDDDYMRLSYATSLENIKEGLNRIEEYIK